MNISKKQKTIIIILGIIIVIIALLVAGKVETNKSTTVADTNLPGMQTSNGPWDAETSHLRERLGALGLPALSEEGNALHIHQHLDIFIHGKEISVPAEIGINQLAGFISPIHTHDTSNIIHVESPTVQDFNLGQFFDIWGLQFTQNKIGGYQTDNQNTLQVFVDGKVFTGDPRTIVLQSHQEIVIVYGTPEESPKVIPATYNFGKDL